MIADAPDHRGVYVLWSGGVALAVGHAHGGADTIRSRLASHLSHGGAAGIASVTHYSWQLCAEPRERAAQLERELGLVEKTDPAPRRPRASDAEPAQET
ncbi:MAG TPA: hypothetical protein VNU64_23610 [Burkholderiales bacterium]|nr:hypothetical protein [Burkholderiales bacterium]